MVMELRLGNTLTLKKLHPCGSRQWEVVRVGAAIGIRCVGCRRYVLMARALLERRVRAVAESARQEGEQSGGREAPLR